MLGFAFADSRRRAGLIDLGRTRASADQAYVHVAQLHNELGITEPMETTVSQFYTRSYQVIHAERFAKALLKKVDSAFLRSIKRMVGSGDQFADSTDFLDWNEALQSAGSVYDLGK